MMLNIKTRVNKKDMYTLRNSMQNKTNDIIIKKELALSLGELLRRERKKMSISGIELANKVGLSQQQISRYENGVNFITLDMIFKILYSIDIPVMDFMRSLFLDIKQNRYDLFLFYERILTDTSINHNDCDKFKEECPMNYY